VAENSKTKSTSGSDIWFSIINQRARLRAWLLVYRYCDVADNDQHTQMPWFSMALISARKVELTKKKKETMYLQKCVDWQDKSTSWQNLLLTIANSISSSDISLARLLSNRISTSGVSSLRKALNTFFGESRALHLNEVEDTYHRNPLCS